MKNNILHQDFSEYFFEIINQARNGITLCDPAKEDNPLIFVNQAFCDIFGYTSKEIIGRNCRFLQNDDTSQINLEKIREAIREEKEVTAVLRNYTKSGELIYNEIKISPLFDKKTNKLKYFLGVQKNITNVVFSTDQNYLKKLLQLEQSPETLDTKSIQKLLQELQIYQVELLAQNEELIEKDKRMILLNMEFGALFKEAPMPLLLVDEQLQIVKFNDASDEYFLFTQSKLVIKSLFQYVHKDSVQKLLKWIQYEQYKQYTIDVDMNCSEKQRKRFKIKAKRYNLDQSLLLFTLADMQDEYEVQTDLEQKVQKQLTIALEREKFIQEQSKLASMGEMIDVIAHQWKQPLSIVSMRTNFLLSMNEGDFIPRQEVVECRDKVLLQINHLVDTLEQFRDFLRPNKTTQKFSLKKMIDSLLVLIKDDIMNYSIQVTVDAKKDVLFDGVENELKHVLLNIIANAKEIFEERGIEDREIFILLQQKERKIQIQIDDNGGGIPEDIIERLFEKHVSGKAKGTGIGLYMSKQIITKIEGDIEALNIEHPDGSKGARFIITLIV